jgi:hypothetical protein
MTRQLTSAVSHKLLRSPHAQRLPPGGFVLTGYTEVRSREIVTYGLPTTRPELHLSLSTTLCCPNEIKLMPMDISSG